MSGSRFQPHFVLLCDQLNLDLLLPYLRQERMVTSDEYETLTNVAYTKKQQRERLLIILPRKGRRYFENFGKCLVWSGQVELARHIGVDVDSVPEAPYKPSGESSLWWVGPLVIISRCGYVTAESSHLCHKVENSL